MRQLRTSRLPACLRHITRDLLDFGYRQDQFGHDICYIYIHCVPISLIYSELGDIPQLLDTEDMVTMAEPDWKCVYTYLVEFYKRIRELGLL